jgi:hypothetical protein
VKNSLLFLFFLVFNYQISNSQTGPAGVGTSSNNVLWLKADAGTSTTNSGTAINFWNDQSGNGINVSQSTNAQKPLYRENIMNGFPSIEFDGNSTAGQNDYLTAPDNPLLDNTNGYAIFTVSRLKGFTGDAQAILAKRTTIDVDEAFMLFFWTSNYFYLDIDGLGDRFNTSPTTYTLNTNYILSGQYDGTLAAASRSKIYDGEILRKTSTETSSLVPDKPSPLLIGSTHVGDARAFNGYISETILYRSSLSAPERIIVNNYLAAKYNIALTANDKYVGDDFTNGDYDFEVAGVGKDATGSNNAFASSVSGGIGISIVSGFDNNDYILAGHKTKVNDQIYTDIGGMTGTANARWQRIWYLDVTNTGTAMTTNVSFNMTDGGIGPLVTPVASDYVLLYRAAQTGNWTEVVTATNVSGNTVNFNGVTLSNDGYYTIGTKNYIPSPLPIELLDFNAIMNNGKVDISWITASELNNNYFTIEKSKDGIVFDSVLYVKGAGNSNIELSYNEVDYKPYQGISYYRLKQTDYNGQKKYSNTVAVNYYFGEDGISIFPNPVSQNEAINIEFTTLENKEILVLIRDVSGKEYFSKVIVSSSKNQLTAIDLENKLAAGVYIVIASSNNKLYSKKLIVK